MQIKYLLLLVTLADLAACASLSGTVSATDGKAVRASVYIHDIGTFRVRGASAFDRMLASKADGTFSIASIPAGTYEICVDSPQELVVDPCVWSKAPQIMLKATDSVTGFKVVVARGHMTQIRVNSTVLPDPKGGPLGNSLQMTVSAPGSKIHSFRLLSSDAAGQNHFVVMPFGKPATVVVSSGDFAVKDSSGNRAKNDVMRVPVYVPAGKVLAPVVVNVEKR